MQRNNNTVCGDLIYSQGILYEKTGTIKRTLQP